MVPKNNHHFYENTRLWCRQLLIFRLRVISVISDPKQCDNLGGLVFSFHIKAREVVGENWQYPKRGVLCIRVDEKGTTKI